MFFIIRGLIHFLWSWLPPIRGKLFKVLPINKRLPPTNAICSDGVVCARRGLIPGPGFREHEYKCPTMRTFRPSGLITALPFVYRVGPRRDRTTFFLEGPPPQQLPTISISHSSSQHWVSNSDILIWGSKNVCIPSLISNLKIVSNINSTAMKRTVAVAKIELPSLNATLNANPIPFLYYTAIN